MYLFSQLVSYKMYKYMYLLPLLLFRMQQVLQNNFHCKFFGAKTDFSGFDMENWGKRSSELQHIHAESMLAAKIPS